MTGYLATLACFALIAYLFWLDRGRSEEVSAAIWIPILWMVFAGSRFASQWWNLGPPGAMSLATYSEGSPFDRNVFIALIAAGSWILAKRRINLAALYQQNPWVFLFFLFAALSLLWSDYPDLSLKRWVKGIGNLVMALVILTEKRPYDALGATLRRMAFVLVPLSILFIRYFPELGRTYHMGMAMFTGVALQKNTLGLLCILFAVYFAWLVLLPRQTTEPSSYRPHPFVLLLMAPMILYLLYVARSATAQAVTVVIVMLFLAARWPSFAQKPNRLLVFCGLTGLGFVLLDKTIDLQDRVIRLLGRNPDLTDRRPLWDLVLSMIPNRWVGAGYETFWAGERLQIIWERLGDVSVIQAHNGYIDLYLSLGIIGLCLLGAAIASGFIRIHRSMRTSYATAILRLSFVLIALIYNYTEASIKPLNNVFVLLLFSLLDPPTSKEAVAPTVRQFGHVIIRHQVRGVGTGPFDKRRGLRSYAAGSEPRLREPKPLLGGRCN